MRLSGLHLLLTYQCTCECDHCFVWGSPFQTGTMVLSDIQEILRQAKELGTVEWIYFEGGEPFLYYPVLVRGVRETVTEGFRVGIVTNAYWATHIDDATEWLAPFRGMVDDLSVSRDFYHSENPESEEARVACEAAERLSIPVGVITIGQPETPEMEAASGQLPLGESGVLYRGRAAEKLALRAPQKAWDSFVECPHENLRDPGRVHIDSFGNVHICQGISLGSMFNRALKDICSSYNAEAQPVIASLLSGGPVELVRRYHLPHRDTYADACELCYEARLSLREDFAETLTPDQMYGVPEK